jgi:hypothetical protein
MELATRMPTEMPVGSCSCGAVYACDVTGHNLGTAMIEALVFACNGDWDLAWDLLPEDDYLDKMVKNYDLANHLIVLGGAYEGRNITGVLYFIRLHQDIREVTEEGVQKEIKRATPSVPETPPSKKTIRSLTKKEVEALVKDYNLDSLLDVAEKDKKIIRHLKRLLYAVDDLTRLRAADALGKVSSRIAIIDPGAISKLLQGLFTSISDTAASSWGALDAIGEIIRNNPEQFAGYIPQLYQFLKDRELLVQALMALGNIGEARPDLIRKHAFHFIPLLQDHDMTVRGYAIILLGNLGAHEARDDLEKLMDAPEGIEVYHKGNLENQTIAQLASEALAKI